MERLKEKFSTAEKAMQQFDEIMLIPFSKIVRDAAIYRFLYTLESLWKVAQRFVLLYEGLDVNSPKAAIRASLQIRLLTNEDAESLLQSVDDRDETLQTYNEEFSQKLYQRLPLNLTLLKRWLEVLNKKHLSK